MKSQWSVFIDADTETKADRVFSRFLQQFGALVTDVKTEPYHKGGYVCAFVYQSHVPNWTAMVYDSLLRAQQVGRGWILTGSIEDEVDAWSNDSCVSGVTNIHMVALRDNQR